MAKLSFEPLDKKINLPIFLNEIFLKYNKNPLFAGLVRKILGL